MHRHAVPALPIDPPTNREAEQRAEQLRLTHYSVVEARRALASSKFDGQNLADITFADPRHLCQSTDEQIVPLCVDLTLHRLADGREMLSEAAEQLKDLSESIVRLLEDTA